MFLIVTLLAWHIIGITTSQIEKKHEFSIARILTTLQRSRLQTKILDKLIFVNKNWPFDLQISCVKPTDLAFACKLESNLRMEFKVEFHDDEVDHDDFLNLNEVLKSFFPLCMQLVINWPTCALLTICWRWWIEPSILGFRILSKCIYNFAIWGGQ
jgi:hypothetical protein